MVPRRLTLRMRQWFHRKRNPLQTCYFHVRNPASLRRLFALRIGPAPHICFAGLLKFPQVWTAKHLDRAAAYYLPAASTTTSLSSAWSFAGSDTVGWQVVSTQTSACGFAASRCGSVSRSAGASEAAANVSGE